MARIFDLTEALKELIPVVDGWPLHMQVEPLAGELPPWVIVTITNNGIQRNEMGGAIAGDGRIELRCVSDNTDSVNVWCDDYAIPALQGIVPECGGFTCSCLTLTEDSGTYAAGLTETDTAYRYRVRVLRFDFTWSRHDSP
mgnify:CR=1 FL=1|jgi:hypothetical protein|nr:MAG TPA: hypothetical protein [Caudoviricetes sp.]